MGRKARKYRGSKRRTHHTCRQADHTGAAMNHHPRSWESHITTSHIIMSHGRTNRNGMTEKLFEKITEAHYDAICRSIICQIDGWNLLLVSLTPY